MLLLFFCVSLQILCMVLGSFEAAASAAAAVRGSLPQHVLLIWALAVSSVDYSCHLRKHFSL